MTEKSTVSNTLQCVYTALCNSTEMSKTRQPEIKVTYRSRTRLDLGVKIQQYEEFHVWWNETVHSTDQVFLEASAPIQTYTHGTAMHNYMWLKWTTHGNMCLKYDITVQGQGE